MGSRRAPAVAGAGDRGRTIDRMCESVSIQPTAVSVYDAGSADRRDPGDLQTALECGDGSAVVKAYGGVASTQQQEPGYDGKRTAAGDSGLQSGAGGDVPGGTARQSQPTPTQFFFCSNRGASSPAGFRPCRHR